MTDNTITFQPMGRRVPADGRSSLLELAGRTGVGIEAACGGRGICGKCRVQIRGSSSTPQPSELDLLGEDAAAGYRLACQARIPGPASVWVPESSRLQKQVILTTGQPYDIDIDPEIRCFDLEIPQPELSRVIADRERVLGRLSKVAECDPDLSWRVPLRLLRSLDHTLREDSGRLCVAASHSGKILDLCSGRGRDCLGLAVDLGTTTIVAYLIDLKTGKPLSVKADMNPQVSLGEDVISRISICQNTPQGLDHLGSLARQCIDRLARDACREAGVDPLRIFDCVVVGNTAMHHIFLGLNPSNLAAAPYTPVASDGLDSLASAVELAFAPECRLHTLPVKAGFVGADTVAVALALNADQVLEPTLMIDLGTNGEIILATPDAILCCSTAAGPAFEGGHIRWGMRGAPGAVDGVCIPSADHAPSLSVIEGKLPLGICGSGLVSLVSELVRTGIITREGGFNTSSRCPRLRVGLEGLEYVLAGAHESGTGQDLVFTHKDLSQVQLAKAAIHAGISIMMTELGVSRISRVLLAGAFGNYLNPAAACGITLFPGVEKDRVAGVGNAAGAGAIMALVSRSQRMRARTLARRMHYLELSAHSRFSDAFVDGMGFPA